MPLSKESFIGIRIAICFVVTCVALYLSYTSLGDVMVFGAMAYVPTLSAFGVSVLLWWSLRVGTVLWIIMGLFFGAQVLRNWHEMAAWPTPYFRLVGIHFLLVAVAGLLLVWTVKYDRQFKRS